MNKKILTKTLLAGAMALLMVGCKADGDGSAGGAGGAGLNPGGGEGTVFPNNGTVGGEITENGNVLPGNFICTQSAQAAFGALTVTGANGLVGDALTPLLNMLGAGPATRLLNSVSESDFAIDGNLLTGSTFTLPAGLLLNFVDSIDQSIFNISVPAGGYAVFGVTFPEGAVDLSLLNSITVTTYQGDTERESRSFLLTAIDLLGQNVFGEQIGFFGMRVTQAYDRVTIALEPPLAPDVGAAMRVHEMCSSGYFVNP